MRDQRGEGRCPLADQALHACRDVRAREERLALPFGGDQRVELFDLVADFDRKCVVLELTSIADGLHL